MDAYYVPRSLKRGWCGDADEEEAGISVFHGLYIPSFGKRFTKGHVYPVNSSEFEDVLEQYSLSQKFKDNDVQKVSLDEKQVQAILNIDQQLKISLEDLLTPLFEVNTS